MKTTLFVFVLAIISPTAFSQSPVGKWKVVFHTIVFDGKTMDMQAALLQQRPCAAKVIWEINADKTFRLNASQSGCDESYKNIQQKMYARTKWKLEGNRFTTSATNFAVGQSYTVVFLGNKMIMTGIDGQGTITYQKL